MSRTVPAASIGTPYGSVTGSGAGLPSYQKVYSAGVMNFLAVDGTGLTDHLITMTKNKKGTIVKASTSALDVTGHAFGVTWVSN